MTDTRHERELFVPRIFAKAARIKQHLKVTRHTVTVRPECSAKPNVSRGKRDLTSSILWFWEKSIKQYSEFARGIFLVPP